MSWLAPTVVAHVAGGLGAGRRACDDSARREHADRGRDDE